MVLGASTSHKPPFDGTGRRSRAATEVSEEKIALPRSEERGGCNRSPSLLRAANPRRES